jgi:hypothetical protein
MVELKMSKRALREPEQIRQDCAAKFRPGTCLVYSDFKEMSYDQGAMLYHYLADGGFALGQDSEKTEDGKHRT